MYQMTGLYASLSCMADLAQFWGGQLVDCRARSPVVLSLLSALVHPVLKS